MCPQGSGEHRKCDWFYWRRRGRVIKNILEVKLWVQLWYSGEGGRKILGKFSARLRNNWGNDT